MVGNFKRKKIFLLPILLITLAFAPHYLGDQVIDRPSGVHAASVDYFLKIPGVEGEASGRGHDEEIEIVSWSWGETNESTEQGSAASRRGGATLNELTKIDFEASMSKASPQILEALAHRTTFEEASLFGVKQNDDGDFEFFEIKMHNVFISSYQTGGSSGMIPGDSFSLNFEKVEFLYIPQEADGTAGDGVEFGWDLQKNKKI